MYNFSIPLLFTECTFLVLNKAVYEQTKDEIGKNVNQKLFSTCNSLFQHSLFSLEALIGDTNLFLNQDYFLSGSDDECAQHNLNNETIIAEAEIMIAEPEARGKGFGKEALLLMLKYGQSELGVQEFVSKIGYENVTSQILFGKLQFEEQSRSDVFQEIAFKRSVNDKWIEWLNNEISSFNIEEYSR